MDRLDAYKTAVEITKTTLASCEIQSVPYDQMADNIADFIETLTNRLAEIEVDN